ncbi:MAG: glycosyltransferase family 2 protein [Proteobacteria bacterium]|nr:glycosyltransferase family 2 protein [Pseudomonadota bacterium]
MNAGAPDSGFAVSVVIPTYNRADKLLRALHSVLNQSLPAVEIIIVDDASTDGTAQIDFAALSPRIRLIRSAQNLGGAVSRNKGVQCASGNWIAFLDSDDVWLPDKLQRQREIARRRPTADIFICGNVISRKIDGAESLYNKRAPRHGEDLSEYFLIEGNSFQISSLVVPAHAFRRVRFDETLSRHQDWDLVLNLVRAGFDYEYCDEPLAVYCDDLDLTRISRQRDPAPTLHWFNVSGDKVSTAGAAYLYSYLYFPRHLRARTTEALKVIGKLSTRDLRSLQSTSHALSRRFREEVRRVLARAHS